MGRVEIVWMMMGVLGVLGSEYPLVSNSAPVSLTLDRGQGGTLIVDVPTDNTGDMLNIHWHYINGNDYPPEISVHEVYPQGKDGKEKDRVMVFSLGEVIGLIDTQSISIPLIGKDSDHRQYHIRVRASLHGGVSILSMLTTLDNIPYPSTQSSISTILGQMDGSSTIVLDPPSSLEISACTGNNINIHSWGIDSMGRQGGLAETIISAGVWVLSAQEGRGYREMRVRVEGREGNTVIRIARGGKEGIGRPNIVKDNDGGYDVFYANNRAEKRVERYLVAGQDYSAVLFRQVCGFDRAVLAYTQARDKEEKERILEGYLLREKGQRKGQILKPDATYKVELGRDQNSHYRLSKGSYFKAGDDSEEPIFLDGVLDSNRYFYLGQTVKLDRDQDYTTSRLVDKFEGSWSTQIKAAVGTDNILNIIIGVIAVLLVGTAILFVVRRETVKRKINLREAQKIEVESDGVPGSSIHD